MAVTLILTGRAGQETRAGRWTGTRRGRGRACGTDTVPEPDPANRQSASRRKDRCRRVWL